MASPPLLSLAGVRLRLGTQQLLDGAELSVSRGDRVVLVGRNGSGKSTMLKVAAGLLEPDAGTRFLQPGATLRYLPQEPDLSGHDTVMSWVMAGLTEGDDEWRVPMYLEKLGLTGDEHPSSLSGGEARRAALVRTLAPEPDILLLDEPTNHLDLPTIEWLEEELAGLRTALVIISHDRRFLDRLGKSIVWLDRGTTRRAEISFDKFEGWRDEVMEQEERDAQKLDRKIAAEEHWVRYGVTARRKRNVRRMGELSSLRDQRRSARSAANQASGQVSMSASEADVSGKQVIDAKAISKHFGDRAIVSNLTLRLLRGDRLGIIGPNGAGKTTLINMLTGAVPPDEGVIRLGSNLELATLDQRRALLDPDATLAETLTGGRGDNVFIGGQPRHVVSYMADFLFPPEVARTPVKVLSGGERARLMLALAMAKSSNLMVLDEPTNDLDLETLDVLEEMLGAYSGTVILISHDRDFLDRIVDAVLVPEGDGHWQEYAGGYTDMLRQRGQEIASTKQVARATAVKYPEKQVAAPAAQSAAKSGAKSAARRMTFKDKHALETLPKTIADMQVKLKTVQAKLGDADLYARDHASFKKFTAEAARLQADIATSEDRWLELEMMKADIDGA